MLHRPRTVWYAQEDPNSASGSGGERIRTATLLRAKQALSR